MKHPPRVWFFLLGIAPFLLVGCGREEPIRVYEAVSSPRPMSLETPNSWRRVPRRQGEPRDIICKFEAGEGRNAVRINASLPGGTLLANVNRWRGQVHLEPIGEAELAKQFTPLKIDQYEGHYLELVAPENFAAEKSALPADHPVPPMMKARTDVREAIYAAVIPDKGSLWVFRLIGPMEAAQRERTAFKSFVENGLRALTLAAAKPRTDPSRADEAGAVTTHPEKATAGKPSAEKVSAGKARVEKANAEKTSAEDTDHGS